MGQWHNEQGSEDSRFGGSGPLVCRGLDWKPEAFRLESQMQTNKAESGLVAKPICPLEQAPTPYPPPG